MITKFKIFEDVFLCASRVPIVGDYIVLQLKDYIVHKFKRVDTNIPIDFFSSTSLNEMYEFFNNNIGEIIKIEESGIGYKIEVKYDKNILMEREKIYEDRKNKIDTEYDEVYKELGITL